MPDSKYYVRTRARTCNRVCMKTEVRRNQRMTMREQGIKRCGDCMVYFKTEAHYCPCCMQRLRMSSRTNKRLRENHQYIEDVSP